jgi:hypothetical protein
LLRSTDLCAAHVNIFVHPKMRPGYAGHFDMLCFDILSTHFASASTR